MIRDLDPASGRENLLVPAHMLPDEQVLGLAYDPFTDHLFLRIYPGNFVRVVDRPARQIKRDFVAPRVPIGGGGDLAIRSRDRHLFFNHPQAPALVETTLHGRFVRKIQLDGLTQPVHGVAHDAREDEFLILPAPLGTRLLRYTTDGRLLVELELEHPVRGHSLAYDSRERSSYATLADGSALGIFDARGRLLRRLPFASPDTDALFDVGPRSFIRLF